MNLFSILYEYFFVCKLHIYKDETDSWHTAVNTMQAHMLSYVSFSIEYDRILYNVIVSNTLMLLSKLTD